MFDINEEVVDSKDLVEIEALNAEEINSKEIEAVNSHEIGKQKEKENSKETIFLM